MFVELAQETGSGKYLKKGTYKQTNTVSHICLVLFLGLAIGQAKYSIENNKYNINIVQTKLSRNEGGKINVLESFGIREQFFIAALNTHTTNKTFGNFFVYQHKDTLL